jgi:hypothetical protein
MDTLVEFSSRSLADNLTHLDHDDKKPRAEPGLRQRSRQIEGRKALFLKSTENLTSIIRCISVTKVL